MPRGIEEKRGAKRGGENATEVGRATKAAEKIKESAERYGQHGVYACLSVCPRLSKCVRYYYFSSRLLPRAEQEGGAVQIPGLKGARWAGLRAGSNNACHKKC